MRKNRTCRAPWHSALWLAAVLAAGCAGGPSMDMGMGASSRAVVGTPLSNGDRDFATKVAGKGMYEVEVSKLAAERALNAGVRSYAQMMVAHHTQINNELVALMSARGVAPPRTLAADKSAKLHRLAALPRSDAFDNGYIRVVGIEDHRASIAMFEKARREVKDRELRAWIDRTLVVMRNHLTAAQGVAGALAG